MHHRHASDLRSWRKSSFSGEAGNCLEIADGLPDVPVRDSKTPHAPTLAVDRAAWAVFVEAVKADRFR